MTAATDGVVLAVDIGGTKVAVAIVDEGRIVARRQVSTPRTGRGMDIVAAIVREARALPPAVAVGVATTGLVDGSRLTALNPRTLPIENNFPLGDELQRKLNVPVLVINDAQAAAWAEFRKGAGQGAGRMLFMTVSTGIGAGMVLDGKLQTGAHGLAGHLGHVVIDPDSAEVCGCGRRGCIEMIASGTAIAAAASRILARSVTTPEVFALAAAGNGSAEAVLNQAAKVVAIVLANAVASLDLDRLVLGGGVGLATGFLAKVAAGLGSEPRMFHRPIGAAMLGADAGLIGAALLASGGKFHRQ